MDGKKKHRIRKAVVVVLAIGVLELVAILAYQFWQRAFVVRLRPTDDSIVVTVGTALSNEDLSNDYHIVVYDSSNKVHSSIDFDGKTKEVSYSKSHLMDGEKYVFSLERKDRKKIEILKYKTSMKYAMPQVIDEEEVPSQPIRIKYISSGTPDETNGVWNNIVITMEDKTKEYEYSIGRKTQDKPVFNGIRPGTYTVLVKDKSGNQDSQVYTVNTIQPKGDPLTVQEVQNTIDQVSARTMSPSDAQEKLANGGVNLAETILVDEDGQISTLWGVLTAARRGSRFMVESFQLEPSTNKIKSGTLRIKML